MLELLLIMIYRQGLVRRPLLLQILLLAAVSRLLLTVGSKIKLI